MMVLTLIDTSPSSWAGLTSVAVRHYHPGNTYLGTVPVRGILTGIGNKPPWTLPAKAAYSKYDGKRAQRYFGHDFEIPSWFPILSLLVCLI